MSMRTVGQMNQATELTYKSSWFEDKLWELREASCRDGIARAIYVTAIGRRVVIVRIFIKKTQKTPPHELKLARARAKEVK